MATRKANRRRPPRPVQPWLKDDLQRAIAEAEAELLQQGRPREAWRCMNVHFEGPMPVFGGNLLQQEQLLGPPYPLHPQRGVPTRAIPILRRIRQHTDRCGVCRPLVEQAPSSFQEESRIAAVKECRYGNRLFAEYDRQVGEPIPDLIDEGPAWRAAYMAAVADSALQSDDPRTLFVAGRYLERQRLIAYLLRRLPEEARDAAARAYRQYTAAEQRRRRKGGRAKLGRRLPHTELIRRALLYDGAMDELGQNWLANAPRRRTLPEVVKLFQDGDVLENLIVGGDHGPRLPLINVEVDEEDEKVDVTAAGGRERLLTFKAVADIIARLKKGRR